MCTHKSDVGNSGSKRSRTEEVDGTGVDRISDLPEPLLILILSFLPTLYAVRTSVLSRRWNNLWTRVPGLKFGSELLARKGMFGAGIMRGDFVDSLLLRYNDLNFEELDLGSEWSDDDGLNMLDHLPQTIFSSTTLVVLRLKNLYLMCNALPPSASITCVKTLQLDSLRYANDAYESTLISNCVELEDLSIRKDASGYMNDFRVHAQRLKRLKIRIHQEAEYGEDGELYAIHINAPNLLDLDIEDDGLYYPLLADVGNLKKAKIDLNSVNAFKSLLNCFSALKTVESLHLSSSHIKQVCNLEHAGLAVQNVNLTHLTLGVGSVWVRLLPYFFRCFPNLRVLILKKEPSVCKYDGKLCTNPKLLPTGLLSRLEVFVAEEFRGTNVELGLLEYVLKNGKGLDSVQLQCTSNGTRGRELEADYYEDMLRITQKILYFPRASEKCRIEFDREQRRLGS